MNKHIIFENLAGRTTPLQKQIIAQWLAEPENMELYYAWLDEWENNNLQFEADEAPALQKIMNSNHAGGVAQDSFRRKSMIYRLLSTRMMAASVFICLVASLFLVKDSILYKSIKTSYGEIRSLTLPDGSQVSMNANSTIRFPRFGFGENSRIVHLSGEAEFSVVHTRSNQKFIVQTDKQLDITVLGTRFTVYARQSQSKVVLQNGKVELSYLAGEANKKIMMKPGDMFIASNSGKTQLKKVENPAKLTAWRNHEFVFDATSLREIAGIIKDTYGVELQFENETLSRKTISGSFHADKLEELVNAISELLGIRYTTRGNSIYFIQ